jgi:tRNA(Ile)-lysidine synthase
MAPQRGWRIRPLLACRRDELRVELQARGETWREDHTNADRSLLRNRLRHEVLPLLRAHFNPRVDEALARAADILRIDDEYLADAAAGAYGRLVSVRSDCVHVDRDGLLALPPAISSRVALRALETADPGRSYGREQAARVVAAAGGGGPADLWGQRVERLPRVVVLRKRVALPRPAACALEFPLPVPGIASDPGAGWTIEASGPGRVSPGRVASRDIVQVDAGAVAAGLVVRMRRPGDWLQPLGLNGRKKVQDVFVDRKVPRDDRDRVPIVAEAGPDGRIVWVAGHVLAEPFGVTSATTAVVTLTLRRENALGGSC